MFFVLVSFESDFLRLFRTNICQEGHFEIISHLQTLLLMSYFFYTKMKNWHSSVKDIWFMKPVKNINIL